MDEATMWTPAGKEEVTADWLGFILSQYESRTSPGTSVTVTSFQINPGVAAGENFSSQLVKIHVIGNIQSTKNGSLYKGDDINEPKESCNEAAGGHTKEYNLLAKFLQDGAFGNEASKAFGAPQREVMLFSDVMPALNQFTGDDDSLRVLVPDFIYGVCREGEFVLVMEDVRLAGYLNNDKRKGLSLDQCLVAVESLAKLHAVSYAYDAKHSFLNKFPQFKLPAIARTLYPKIAMIFYDLIADILKEKDPDFSKTITQNRSFFKSQFHSFTSTENRLFSCLCHGDFWNNNFMFKAKDDNDAGLDDPSSVLLVDWGNVKFENPYMDLQYILHTSTTLEFRKKHREEVIKHYYSVFTETLNKLDANLPSWSYEVFLEEMNKLKTMAVILGVIVCSITLAETGVKMTKKRESVKPANSTGLGWKIGTSLGKKTGQLFLNQSFRHLIKSMFKKFIEPFAKEIKSGENELMNTRIFDLLKEAKENGAFTV